MQIITLITIIIFFIILKYNVNILKDKENWFYLHYTSYKKEWDGQVNKYRICIKLFKV